MLSYRSKDKLLLSLSAYLTFYLFIFNCHSLVFYIIFLYLHLFIYVSFCFSIYMSYLPVSFLSIYTSLYILSTYQSVVLSIYLDIFLSICFSICLFIQLNIYLYINMAIGWRWARRGAPPASWRRQVALRLAQVDKVFTSTRKKALQAKTQIYENDIMILSF